MRSGALKSPRSLNGLLVPSKSFGGGMKESRVPREEVSSLLHSLQSNEVFLVRNDTNSVNYSTRLVIPMKQSSLNTRDFHK